MPPSEAWKDDIGDRHQHIIFISSAPLNDVMLYKLIEACLIKSTDEVQLDSTFTSDGQGE